MIAAVRPSQGSARQVAPAIILAVSIPIAVIAPFDEAFGLITLGSPMLRAIVMAMIASIGIWSATLAELKLTGTPRAMMAGIFGAVLVAAYVLVIDCYAFRHTLSPTYVQIFHHPLAERYTYFMLRAFNENVIYRLFVFSTSVALIARAAKMDASQMPPTAILAIMIATQWLNIGINVTMISEVPTTPLSLLYNTLRYIVPGVVWAWLFQRFGFAAAEIASVGCHLFLQPALGILL